MQLLFISNFYPPYTVGGQELSCQQVVDGLRRRGHQIYVLTSNFGQGRNNWHADGIDRALHLEVSLTPWRHTIDFFASRARNLQHNLHYARRVIEEFEPDLVFIWGMWNLSPQLPALAEALCPNRVVYRFADYWPTLPSAQRAYWDAPTRRWFSRLPKKLLRSVALALLDREPPPPALRFEHAFCISAALREKLAAAGVPVHTSRVISPGIEGDLFARPRRLRGSEDRSLGLLYAGRLVPEKGVEVALRALARLAQARGLSSPRLALAGAGSSQYVSYLRRLASQLGVQEHVSFLGQVPDASMPALLASYDVLLVPSIWTEPFGRVVLEGMASGMVVIASSAGGPSEVIQNGVNGLLVAPGDEADLAARIAVVGAEPGLRARLAAAARQTVFQKYHSATMLDQIEQYLREVLGAAAQRPDRHYAAAFDRSPHR
jgi:glycogen synthase